MPDCVQSILIYGLDPTLLQTRAWVLQRSGYRILTATQLSHFADIPQQPPVSLLIVCHSLDPQNCQEAIELASERWPGIRHLTLTVRPVQSAAGSNGDVTLSLDGPGTLISNVNTLVGQPLHAMQ